MPSPQLCHFVLMASSAARFGRPGGRLQQQCNWHRKVGLGDRCLAPCFATLCWWHRPQHDKVSVSVCPWPPLLHDAWRCGPPVTATLHSSDDFSYVILCSRGPGLAGLSSLVDYGAEVGLVSEFKP